MSAPGFSPGDLLAGRFRIVGFIAHGGMGEVYEAEDSTLHERVALKTVRPEVASDPAAVDALVREVQVARKVVHENVCRTFDIYRHEAADAPPIRFVAMELLEGETLAERMKRAGPLTTDEALPIVRQMAAALQAAHEAGVVHQDFKADNVVLMPERTEQGGPVLRAVVADFGLARAKALHGETPEGPMVSGTPAYMAPEQMERGEVTVASDIYALGVVMYEMVTGALPFPGASLQAAMRRLREQPLPPRQHAPTLDPRWEAVILRCLERDPLDRFDSAADVPKALLGEEVTPSRRQVMEHHARTVAARRRNRIALGLAVLVVLGLGELAFLRWSKGRPAPTRRSVAVLGFRNVSGRADVAWLSTALAELLRAELGAGEKLRTIPGESVARMKAELSVSDVDSLARETLTRIGKNLGSDLVLLGSYSAAGKDGEGKLRLDLLLQDTAEGKMVAAVSDEGMVEDLPDLVSRAGARLREKLKVGEVTAADAGGVRAAVPSGPEAARLYSDGLGKLRSFDALAARDLLEKAVAAEPASPLAHAALAASWSALGFDAKAKDEAKKAFDLSASLSREDRLSVEGRYREAVKEWPKAIEVYRTLFGFFPDNLDYGLRLAEAQTSGGKGKDTLATVAALRKLPAPAPEDPRIDLADARAAESLSDYKRCQASAARAAAKGATLGARLLVAQARFQEGRAFMRLSDYPKGLAAAAEAQKTFAHVGDRSGVARSLNLAAGVVWSQGDLSRAKATWEDALAIAREIGDRDVMQRVLNNIAIVLSSQGDPAGAKTMYEQSLAVCREIGDRGGVAQTLSNIAGLLVQRGDLARAEKAYQETLAITREVGARESEAGALLALGGVQRQRGDLLGAIKMHMDALAIYREIANRSGVAVGLLIHGYRLAEQGDLATAGKKYEEALTLFSELGEKAMIAYSRLALADLDIEEGRADRAEAPAREAAEEFRNEKSPRNEADAQTVLARCLLEQRKPREAQEAIDRALALKSQDLEVRLSVAITAARVGVAAGRHAEALKGLEAALAEATKAGFVPSQFEARLALGEVEMKSGQAEAGRARLTALAKDADAKGFGLIARKARKASSGP